ncbi:hypothetical protein BC835DRAFT_1304554 [Cytidiella melzeri]|nr:hypothetical protein BC835DRAFT_1304554 [Cytidiella melzeri]
MPPLTTEGQKSHRYLKRREDGSVVLVDPDSEIQYSYAVDQLKAYHAFDRELRQFKITRESIVPGGYHGFQQVWNCDVDCAWGFTEWDDDTGTPILHGPAVPYSLLIPRVGEVKAAPASNEFLEQLTMFAAKRAVAQSNFQEKKKRDRLLNKRSLAHTGLLGQSSSSSLPKRARTDHYQSAPEEEDPEVEEEGEVNQEQAERGEDNSEPADTTTVEIDQPMHV